MSLVSVREGDVLYEASQERKEVTKWTVMNIYIKDYVTPKTVVEVWNIKFGLIAKSPETVCCWHRTKAEAKECLEEMLL